MLELVCATGPANRATPRLRQATPQIDRTIRQVSPVMGPKSPLRSEQWRLGAQSDLKTSGTSGPLGRPIDYCTFFSLAVVFHRLLHVLAPAGVLHRLLQVLSLAGALRRLLQVLFDRVNAANRCVVGVLAELLFRPPLPEQIPALVQRTFQQGELSVLFLRIDLAALHPASQLMFAIDQGIDLSEDLSFVHRHS